MGFCGERLFGYSTLWQMPFLILAKVLFNMTGFPQAIEAAYPDTPVPLCIVHLVRNGLRYVS